VISGVRPPPTLTGGSGAPIRVSEAQRSIAAVPASQSVQIEAQTPSPRSFSKPRRPHLGPALPGLSTKGPDQLQNKNVTGSSNANGTWTLRLRVGDATPGTRVVVAVRVSRRGSAGSCQASFRPRAAAVSAVAAPAIQPAAPPSSAPAATQPAAPPSSASAAPTTAASCYPLSDEGTCYEPGEYCRDDDHGMSGVAGDGESIVCEDNDGWRWEPA